LQQPDKIFSPTSENLVHILMSRHASLGNARAMATTPTSQIRTCANVGRWHSHEERSVPHASGCFERVKLGAEICCRQQCGVRHVDVAATVKRLQESASLLRIV
jgi:hypothetical protein